MGNCIRKASFCTIFTDNAVLMGGVKMGILGSLEYHNCHKGL